MPKSEKRQVNFMTDKKEIEMYQRLYPYSLTRFLNACIHFAVKNNEFVFKVIGAYADENRNF